jgi:enoyl-CoA hydratase/carnithine racemase
MSERVSVTVDQGVADVRLRRVDKINALDRPMFAALLDAARQVSETPGVRAAVLSGEGRGFSVGIDVGSLQDSSQLRRLADRTHGIANLFQGAVWAWRELPVPVIAAVHGFAFGGGFQLMLGADIRIAAPSTKLSIMEAKYGLVPDMAGVALLRNLVRDDVARELTYTGRIFDGVEAERLGVVTRLANDPYAEALALARTIAAGSPRALKAAKRLFNAAADEAQTAAQVLLAEAVEQTELMAGADHAEAVRAAAAKRAPVFED